MDSKLSMIISKLTSLQCRHPSEHTKKLASTFWFEVSDARNLSAESKRRMKDHLSRSLLNAIKTNTEPDRNILVLPTTERFRVDYPDLWATLFSAAKPVPCKIDARTLLEQDLMSKCRSRIDSGCTDLSRGNTMHLSLGSASSSPLEQFGGWMMKGMEQMQATQNKVMELLIGGQGLPRSLSGLQSTQSLTTTPPRRDLGRPSILLHGSSPLTLEPPKPILAHAETSEESSTKALPTPTLTTSPTLPHSPPTLSQSVSLLPASEKARRVQCTVKTKVARESVGGVVGEMLRERAGDNAGAKKAANTKLEAGSAREPTVHCLKGEGEAKKSTSEGGGVVRVDKSKAKCGVGKAKSSGVKAKGSGCKLKGVGKGKGAAMAKSCGDKAKRGIDCKGSERKRPCMH